MNKVEKIKKLADAMYNRMFNLTTDTSGIRKAMDEYHQFIINEYYKEDTEKDFSIKESVIPFGASDSELMEATYFIPQGYHAVIDGNKVIIKKGEEPVSNDLEEAAREWLKPKLDKSYINYGEAKMMELTHFDGYAMLDATEFGAQWQKEQMIDKACEWLKDNTDRYLYNTGGYEEYIPKCGGKMFKDFKKAMEK